MKFTHCAQRITESPAPDCSTRCALVRGVESLGTGRVVGVVLNRATTNLRDYGYGYGYGRYGRYYETAESDEST